MGIKLQFPMGINKLALKAEDAKITPDWQGLVFFFFLPNVIFPTVDSTNAGPRQVSWCRRGRAIFAL